MRFLPKLVLAAMVCFGAPAVASTLGAETSEAYSSESFDWMLGESFVGAHTIQEGKGDPEGIKILAGLFRSQDERASTALQNYLSRFPDDPAAFDLAGTDLLRQQDFATAAQAFSKAAQLDPASSWVRAKLGVALILGGQVEPGLDMMENVLLSDPDNPLALRYLAWDALRDGDAGRAIIYAERSLNAFGLPEGQINSAHVDLARLYHQTGQYDRLLAFLNPAIGNDNLTASPRVAFEVNGLYFEAALRDRKAVPARVALETLKGIVGTDRPEMQVSEARILTLEGQYDDAIAILTTLRATHPNLAEPLIPDLAIAEAGKGETDTAIRRLVELAGVRGPGQDLPLLREAIGMFFAAGRGDEAIEMIRQRAQMAPDRIDLRHMLTEALLRAENTQEALVLARSVASESQNDALAQYTAGIAAAAAKQTDEAVSYFEASLAIEPRDERTWLTLLGTSHGHNTYGHGAEASHPEVRALLDRAIEAIPGSADLRYELGLLMLSEGLPQDAIAVFDAAIAQSPGHLPSLTLSVLARADARIDLPTAERHLTIAQALRSNDVVINDVTGWLKVAQGEIDSGTQILEAALAQDPDDATIQYHLAVAYAAQGNEDAALEQYMTALTGDLYFHYETDARAGLVRLSPQSEIVVPVNRIDSAGVHEKVGDVTFMAMNGGLHVTGTITGIKPGANGAHIHMRPTCAPATGPDGGITGGLAGDHFGHHDHDTMIDDAKMLNDDGTVMDHSGMAMDGMQPRGDLPALVANDNGVADFAFMKMDLSLDDIRGRSIMIHAGPDGDDGTSGPKIACAVIP